MSSSRRSPDAADVVATFASLEQVPLGGTAVRTQSRSRAGCSQHPHRGARGTERRRTVCCRLARRDHEENAVLWASRTRSRSLGGISGRTRSPYTSPEAICYTSDCVGADVCRAGWRCSLPAGAVLWSPAARGLSRRPCTAQFALPDLGGSTECVFVALVSMLRCGSGDAVSRGPPFAACVPAPGVGGGGGGRVETRGEGTAGEAGGHAGEKGCRVGCRSFSLDAAGLKLPGRLRRRSLGCLWQPLHVPSCGAF